MNNKSVRRNGIYWRCVVANCHGWWQGLLLGFRAPTFPLVRLENMGCVVLRIARHGVDLKSVFNRLLSLLYSFVFKEVLCLHYVFAIKR